MPTSRQSFRRGDRVVVTVNYQAIRAETEVTFVRNTDMDAIVEWEGGWPGGSRIECYRYNLDPERHYYYVPSALLAPAGEPTGDLSIREGDRVRVTGWDTSVPYGHESRAHALGTDWAGIQHVLINWAGGMPASSLLDQYRVVVPEPDGRYWWIPTAHLERVDDSSDPPEPTPAIRTYEVPEEERYLTIIRRGTGAQGAYFLRLPHGSDCRITSVGFLNREHRRILEAHGNVVLRLSYYEARGWGQLLHREHARHAFKNALAYIRQDIKGAYGPDDADPDTGLPPPSIEQRKAYRQTLPADRCPFCKNKTDVHRTCDGCGETCFATCKACQAMGAPEIRAPRRMSEVRTAKGKKRLCFPHCVRERAYKCNHCGDRVDASAMHAEGRQEGNTRRCICKRCHARDKVTICCMCHQMTRQRPEWRDAQGDKCERCFRRNNSFTPVAKDMKVITKFKKESDARTFGIELEVNHVHHMDWLRNEIADLDIGGVQFIVKPDGSVAHGFEVVSFPAERRLLLPAVKLLCQVVRKYRHSYEGAGLHVHVRDNRVDPAHAFRVWYALEPFTYSFLPRFRDSFYSKMQRVKLSRLLRVEDIEDAREIVYERYASLNLQALTKYRTLEIRCHHATTSYRDIYHFLTYINRLWDIAAGRPDNDAITRLYEVAHRDGDNFREVADALSLPFITRTALKANRDMYAKHPHLTSGDMVHVARTAIDNAMSEGPALAATAHGTVSPSDLPFWTARTRNDVRLVQVERQLRRAFTSQG